MLIIILSVFTFPSYSFFFFSFFFVCLFCPVSESYKLQLNSTFYYANISSNTLLNSTVLNFTLFINNSYYQTPKLVTFQLGSSNQFSSYFGFSNRQAVVSLSFNTSNPDHTVDQLKLSQNIIYLKEAPAGDYQTTISVLVRSREEVGLTPQEDLQISTVAITVTKGII